MRRLVAWLLCCGLLGLMFSGVSQALVVSDSFPAGSAGTSIQGRLTDTGGAVWQVGASAVLTADGAVCSGGAEASQATVPLASANYYQTISIAADVVVSSSDDYVSLGFCPSSNPDWSGLSEPSIRIHPNGNFDNYGLSGGTISGFTANVSHHIEVQYHKANRNVKFYCDNQLIQDQWVWQEWGTNPTYVGFRINSAASGLSRIDNFTCTYTSDLSARPAVSPVSGSAGFGGGSATFYVSNAGNGTLTWTASSDSSWLTVSPSSGTDTVVVTATAAANGSAAARTGVITVTNGSQNATFTMAQAGAPLIRDSFTSGTAGTSIQGRLTETGGAMWQVGTGTSAVLTADGAVFSNGAGASQAMIPLASANYYQTISIAADVVVSSSDDYVGLGFSTSSDPDWNGLSEPSIRIHPSGSFEMYGLDSGTINGFTANVSHHIEVQYHKANRNFKLYYDNQLIKDQYVWQEWTANPTYIGFRINSAASGLSRIDNFACAYTSDLSATPVVSPASGSAGFGGGSATFTVSNAGSGALIWTATSDSSWLTVSPASGTDTVLVTATAAANTTVASRTGIITVTSGAQSKTFTMTQAGAPALADFFNSGTTGASIDGRMTDTGMAVWHIGPGTAAVLTADGAVSSGGAGASQATVQLNGADLSQPLSISADILVASGDDYVSLGYCSASQPNWSGLNLPSIRIHPDGSFDNYGLSGGTISGFTAGVYHHVEVRYDVVNKNVYFYFDNQLIQSQWIWQSWTDVPSYVGFRINNASSGQSRIDNFGCNYVQLPALSVLPETLSIGSAGGSTAVSVQNAGSGTLLWMAESNSNWLSVDPESGINNATVTVNCAENMTGFYRTGVITFSGNAQIRKVTVLQAGADVTVEPFTDGFTSFDTSRWQVYTSAKAVDGGYFTSTPASRQVSITSNGQLALPINAGDTFQEGNDYSNVVVAVAPQNWKTVTVKIKGSTAFDDPYGWNQFNLLLWNDEDNHVKFDFQTNDMNNGGVLAGHMTVGYGIETAGIRWSQQATINDNVSNAKDLTLKLEKNVDGTYKLSIGVAGGPLSVVPGCENVAFASEAGVVQTPKYIGLYAGAGRSTDTTYWYPYDPTANRSVDVLVDEFTVSDTTAMLPGDANGDNKVDVSDLGILAANYGTTSGAVWAMGDFNADGKVDVSDLGILAANYGTGTGTALDFNQDAQAFGLTAKADADTPVTSTLGCGSVGLPLVIGLALMGLMLVKLEE